MPNLLDVQLRSFSKFLQHEIPVSERVNEGLQEVFNNVFPISDSRGLYSLEFVSYSIGDPKYSVEECQERDLTFAAPLKTTLRLRIREEQEGQKKEKEIIEQEVYLGELPLITDKGTFIINGAERVIVSQLHRSPGVFFDSSIHANGKGSSAPGSFPIGDPGWSSRWTSKRSCTSTSTGSGSSRSRCC